MAGEERNSRNEIQASEARLNKRHGSCLGLRLCLWGQNRPSPLLPASAG